MCKMVLLILMDQRTVNATKVQDILTKYGCMIRARLGLHDVDPDTCSNEGLIFLQMCGPEEKAQQLAEELNEIPGVKAKSVKMSFDK